MNATVPPPLGENDWTRLIARVGHGVRVGQVWLVWAGGWARASRLRLFGLSVKVRRRLDICMMHM